VENKDVHKEEVRRTSGYVKPQVQESLSRKEFIETLQMKLDKRKEDMKEEDKILTYDNRECQMKPKIEYTANVKVPVKVPESVYE